MNHYHMTKTQRKVFDACASGNKAEIFQLTSAGCDLVRLHNKHGQTPLHIACQHMQLDNARLLVEVYGASPDIPDNKGCTPLHEACLAGDLNTVAYMLGVCSNYKSAFTGTDVHGDTILHKACQSGNVAAVRYIVAHMSKISCSGCKLNLYQDNVSSYHKCNKDCNKSSLQCLLHPNVLQLEEHKWTASNDILKGYFEKLNSYGDTPLHIACRYGLLNVVKYIIDEARPVLGFAIELNSLLNVACLTNHANIIQYLLQTDKLSGINTKFHPTGVAVTLRTLTSEALPLLSPLHTACKCGNISLVKTLLRDCRCCLVTKDRNGDTPLHCACISDIVDIINHIVTNFNELHTVQNSKGNTPLHIACEWGSFNAARILITRFHCDPNICNEDGEMPLHLACKYSRLDICKLLLDDDRCNVTVQTSETKETPLHLACCSTAPELVKYLLEKCTPNQDIPDIYGDTPLFNACRSGNIGVVQQLLDGKYCSSFYVNTRTQETPVHIACRMGRLDIVQILLYGYKSQVNQQNLFGETLLHLACQADAHLIVNFLIQNNYCDPKSHSGESSLFIACKSKQIKIVPSSQNLTRNAPLHIACRRNTLEIVKLLACHCDIESVNSDGDTPLHIACKRNHHDVLKYLLEGQSGNLDHLKNDAGSTPLHCACSSSAFDIIKFLIQGQYCEPTETDPEGNTALHIACIVGNVYIAEYLITTGKCDLKKRNTSGYPPLFCALEHGNDELVKHIVEREYVNLDDTDHTLKSEKDEYIPLLHFTYNSEQHLKHVKYQHLPHVRSICNRCKLVKFLIDSGYCNSNQQDSNGNTLVHFVCKHADQKLLLFLLNTVNFDLNQANFDGTTPLHLACSSEVISSSGEAFVKTLLDSGRIKNISPRNKEGKSPIQLTHDYDIIRLLIGYGADPQDVYEHYGQILEQCKKSQPLHLFMKVFVLGNSEAGKSTLVESLKTEVPDPTLVVSDVKGPTAGVVQLEWNSEVFGKVLFHDFAGHPEFESSHSAFLESSLSPSPSSSPPIFILVVNAHNKYQEIIRHLQYWLLFIKNYCGSTEVNPHAIIIGSHADLLSPPELSASVSFLTKALDVSKQSVLECFGPLLLDCRKPGSVEMKSLRTLLKKSCSSLRRYVELDSRCHVLFAYLHEQFTRVPAVTVGDLQRRIRGSRTGLSPSIQLPPYTHHQEFESVSHVARFGQPRRDEVDIPLPFIIDELIRLLDVLHNRSHLLILKGASEIKDYWVVLNQDILLHKVNGTIFAPQNFESHLTVETNPGIVPSSKLDQLFPHLDPNMVKQFLVYSEFCQKIEDDETLKLILGSGDSNSGHSSFVSVESETSFFFFPGLVVAERPAGIWSPNHSDYSYCCGWCVQCKPQHFLTSRFLQVLLLRLVFNYAAAINRDSDAVEVPALNRRCNVWKNGTHWCSRSGVEVLVEVIEQNTMVLLLMQCIQDQEMECVKLRSAIIRKILAAKDKFCSHVEMQEYFLNASDIASYPTNVNKLTKVEMKEVIKTVQDAAPCILHHGGMISLNKLLYFEPYSTLGMKLLTSIFDPENNDKKVPTEMLHEISTLCHPALQQFTHILQVPSNEVAFYREQWKGHPSIVLHHVFEYWQGRKTNGGTYQELREEFEKYSIFCGRNILVDQCPQGCMRPTKDTLNVQ